MYLTLLEQLVYQFIYLPFKAHVTYNFPCQIWPFIFIYMNMDMIWICLSSSRIRIYCFGPRSEIVYFGPQMRIPDLGKPLQFILLLKQIITSLPFSYIISLYTYLTVKWSDISYFSVCIHRECIFLSVKYTHVHTTAIVFFPIFICCYVFFFLVLSLELIRYRIM